MRTDAYGRHIYKVEDLFDYYMQDPHRTMGTVLIDGKFIWPPELELDSAPRFETYQPSELSVEQWDYNNQQIWWMPEKYTNYPIIEWVLGQCGDDPVKLERAATELVEYENRDCLPLLRYLKYLVDTMRKHNIVWGVGRGSSVASYVLYLIGVHKIDSLAHELPASEFFK